MSVVPQLSRPVRAALEAGRPVVALESTIIAHGLPRPQNLAAARSFEALLTETGVTPATIAVVDGVPKAGLDDADLERIALDESVVKVSSRDLGPAMAGKRTAATTVAATSVLAMRAGIRVFATGGLGGVHRGFATSLDESADLTVLSRTPVTVVSAGVKSILDIPATLERLETLGVAVVGFRTSRFPAFYLSDSGQDLDWRQDTAAEIAAVMAARDLLGDVEVDRHAGAAGGTLHVVEEERGHRLAAHPGGVGRGQRLGQHPVVQRRVKLLAGWQRVGYEQGGHVAQQVTSRHHRGDLGRRVQAPVQVLP